MVLWVDGAHGIADIAEHEWNPKREVFSSDLRVVQSISRDADNQNIHNILRAKSWKGDGKYQLIKVDNEASMREGAYVNLEHTLPTWGEVTRFNRKTFEKLKTLNFADLKMDVGEFMSDGEIRQWLSTRDTIVKHIESQAKVRGDVFFAESEVAFNAKERVGKTANQSFRGKFEGKMKAKGVRVRYLPTGDPRLSGAQGRTVLTPKGIKVYLRKAAGKGHAGGRNGPRQPAALDGEESRRLRPSASGSQRGDRFCEARAQVDGGLCEGPGGPHSARP